MRQSVVPEHQTCPSTDPNVPVHHLTPFHCEDCGHVFPCEAYNRIGRCGMCRGAMLPGYGERYNPET